MEKIILLIDNSNIFIAGKEKFGKNARFSYEKFEKKCAKNGNIVEKYLAGSTPPSNDTFWDKMKDKGYRVHTYERVYAGYGHTKEKAVDMVLGVLGGAAIQKIKPDRVVLLTGDRDFIPIAKLRDEMKEEQSYSFVLDVWAFTEALSSELERVCDQVFKIDEYKEELIYFQYEDGTTESFINKEKREAIDKQKREEYFIALEKKGIEEERLAKEERKQFWTRTKWVIGGGAVIILGKKIFKNIMRGG
jgi:uncharacterized LabA/DUF88 family protein